VYDTENQTYAPNANVSFWITKDDATYTLEKINATDALGNASYWFDPNCSHNVGSQYWVAGVTDGCYQLKNISSNYTLNVTGDLKFNITAPNGEKYLRGQTDIIFRGNVSDECDATISNALVNFTAVQNSVEYNCSSLNNEGDGFYNCTAPNSSVASWNPSNYTAPYGYSVKFNATAVNYNYNYTLDSCSPATSGAGCSETNRGFQR
jgi:hypothetical protein